MPGRGDGIDRRAPRQSRSPSITTPCASIQAASAKGDTPETSIAPSTRRPRAVTSPIRLPRSDRRASRALLQSMPSAIAQRSSVSEGTPAPLGPAQSARSSRPSMVAPQTRTPGSRIGHGSGATSRPSSRWRKNAARRTAVWDVSNTAISPRAVRATTSASASSKAAGSKVSARCSSGIRPGR